MLKFPIQKILKLSEIIFKLSLIFLQFYNLSFFLK